VIIFAGGGTGGHLFPGIALAQEIQRRDPDGQVHFLCTEREFDRSQLERYHFPFTPQRTPRSPRSSLHWPAVLFGLWRASRRARALLKEMKPSVVVGLGGYGSLPVLLAAKKLKIPTVLLEQNTVPGRANRVMSRWADRILVQWPESVAAFADSVQDRIEVTGNPVRTDIEALDPTNAREAVGLRPDVRTLLVFGASQGAAGINQVLTGNPDLIRERSKDLQIIHITGNSDYDAVRALYESENLLDAVVVRPFVDSMGTVYSAANLVVGRAGGTSTAELADLGRPVVMVPYPHSADDHQRSNADAVARAGGGLVIEEAEFDREQLTRVLELARVGNGELNRMGQAMRRLNNPNARGRVTDLLMAYGG
jgi:UDP-N-acetylglucosamine--N-acetylmuramyl-(pentapeptide) pyrophosphoryl-undecaprenol N-acetylglucosamine transferase